MCKIKELTFLIISSGLVFYAPCIEQLVNISKVCSLLLLFFHPSSTPAPSAWVSASSRDHRIFRKGPGLAVLSQASSCNSSSQTPYPSPLAGRREIWNLSRQGGFLCFCKSLKWPIFSFAALLSPHNIFFSCSEIHSSNLEMWALYRKSLACTSTNGWVLFPVCSSWCCKGIAKNHWLGHKSNK